MIVALALLLLLAADTVQGKHVCAGPFNATFGTAHVVLKSLVRGGYNAIGYEFGRFNSSALWLGSIEGQSLTRLDLLSFESKVIRNVSEGLSAIGWQSTKARQIANDDAELLLGSAQGGYVHGVKKLGRGSSEVVRDYTAASSKGWPAVALPGVRAFGVEPTSGKLHAVTCVKDGGEDAFWMYDEWRGQFCKVGEGYGCLGHNIVFNADDTVYAVSVDKRQLVRLWSGYPTVVANFSDSVVPTSVGADSTGRLFIGANRVNHNQREAEVYTVDLKTGELQLVAAVGGAQLDTLLVTPDNRVFFTDPAHDAVHEVVLGSRFLDNELRLIRNGNLVSGGRHPGAASGTARKYGHAAFRTEMLTGQEDLATAGGAAAWTTPDGTDLVLLADTYQLKSLTADRFVDSWPLPLAADGAPTRFVGARNVYVAPPRAAPAHEPHAVLVSDWARSTVHLLSPFAPHEGDFDVDATIVSRLVAPYGVALTADGTVLVADFVTGEVTAHAVGAAAPVVIASGLDGPVGLALAPADENGTAVFVTEYKAGRVARIERATGERTVVASGLTRPEGIAVSPLDGRLTVIESGGEHRLLSIDAKTGDVRVVASQLSSAGDSTDGHPGAFAAVSWTQARVLDTDVEFGARSAAALYVALAGSLRRYEAVLRADDDPYHKPTDPALFHVQVPARDDAGRSVVTISLFDETLPAPFAVAVGTWLRFRAFRQDDVHNGVHAPSNTRLLNSNIPGFPSTRLYPASAGSKSGATQPTGPSELLVELTKPGIFYVRDDQYGHTNTSVVVYDAAYDDEASYKYCETPAAIPAPTETPAPPCRTEIECALGYRGNGTKDAGGCYVGTLTCLPIAQTILVWNDRNGGAVHGGNGPYVPPKWHPSDPIEKPSFPGNIYGWAKWREWWQTARPGSDDPSWFWYAPQRKAGIAVGNEDQC